MNKVTIRKAGLYFSFWDDECEDWVERNVTEASLPITWYLNYPIQFDEVITIRDLVKIIEPHAGTLGLVMIHELSGVDIKEICELSTKIASESKKISPNAVYIIKIADAIPTVQDDETVNFLHSYPVLMGLESIDETGENDELHALSSIDFLDWCDLPLGVDDYVEYINPDTEEVIFEGIMNWSLGEIISTVLGQISITLQVTQTSIAKAQPDDGPLQIGAVFDWLDDLDRIFVK